MAIASRDELNEYLKADLFRYCGKTDRKSLRKYKRRSGGFRYTYFMRNCSYYRNCRLLKFILFPYHKFMMRKAGSRYGYEISEFTEIGKGFHIAHSGGLVIHVDSVLGQNVSVSHCVTVGQTVKDGKSSTPVIGNHVYIAPGAKVIGGIKIGSNVAVGANAVVTKDVPDNAVVAGVPAKILSYNGSKDYVINPY